MRQKILYVNACFREGSRTADLVELMKERLFGEGEVTEISLGDLELRPMDRQMLKVYNESVASHAFEDPMFTYARQFREADRVVIAAPFWNYDLPAVLHAYLPSCSRCISPIWSWSVPRALPSILMKRAFTGASARQRS